MGTKSENSGDDKINDLNKGQKSPKKPSHRKRKRHHYNAIRTQMEFYFGDANLSKDRFLKQLIDKDPYVPLDIFLSFNKMKNLTKSVDEIVKALSNSILLELDATQQKVKRKTDIPTQRNVDEKTLYVEALPANTDHEWVRKIFERFGAVSYVSLPKFVKSRKLKGFGFIEFEKESTVQKAIDAFKEFNGVLSTQDTDPAELGSVKSFVKEQNDEEEPTSDTKDTKKKRTFDDEDPNDDVPKTKKVKVEPDKDENNSAITEAVDQDIDNDDDDDDEDDDDDDDDNDEKEASDSGDEKKEDADGNEEDAEDGADGTKKRRKRKKKSKLIKKRRLDINLNADAAYYELKILAKRDWKRLRNKYLNLQREKVSELKRKAWRERQEAQQQTNEAIVEPLLDVAATVTATKAVTPPLNKPKSNERRIHKMNMNFYGAGDDEPQTKGNNKETNKNPALERQPLFSYEPGLIVEVKFTEACVNVKEFKADMRQYSSVKYIDVKEGAMHSHLRVESAIAAEEFIQRINCAEYNCKILSGDAEKDYWKKIELDREMKLNKQVKIPQKRGREKIKKLVTKHIRFGDEDNE